MDAPSVAFDAREIRQHADRARIVANRVRRGTADEIDLRQRADAVLHATDALLLAVTDLRHALAQRALHNGYRGSNRRGGR